MGDLYKVLVVALAHLSLLLPSVILANDQCTNTLFHKQVNDLAASGVHIVVNTPVAVVRHSS